MAKLRHAQDPRAPRRVAPAIANDAGVVQNHHRQSFLAEEVLGDLHEHGRLDGCRLRVEKDATRLLAGSAARGEHLHHFGLGHARQRVGLEERHGEKRDVLQAIHASGTVPEHAVQHVPVGLTALRVMACEGLQHRQQALPLFGLAKAIRRQLQQRPGRTRHRAPSNAL